MKTDIVGGHIYICFNSNRKQYIIPLDKEHNNYNNSDCFDIIKGTILVPVTLRTNCYFYHNYAKKRKTK